VIPSLPTPAALGEIELSEPFETIELGPSRDGAAYRSALVLVRHGGENLGLVQLTPDARGRVEPGDVRHALDDQLPGWEQAPRELEPARQAPEVTVVVVARGSPEALAATVQSILRCDWPSFDVVVVDNRGRSGRTADLLRERFGAHPQLRCVEAPGDGASRARNAGLAVAQGELVAFTDEGVEVDEGWIAELAGAFARTGAACVTGPALPSELETPAQVLIDQLTGSTTDWAPRTLSLPDGAAARRLVVRVAEQLGPACNLALHADTLRSLGGFDATLGSGTLARGGEEIDLYVRLLQAGHAVGYEPRALVRRGHPEALTAVRREAFAHGVGLGSAITKQVQYFEGDRLTSEIRAAAGHLRRKGARASQANRPRAKLLETLALTGLVAAPAAYRQSQRTHARLPAAPELPAIVLEPPPARDRDEPVRAGPPRWADAGLVALIAAAVAVALAPAPAGIRIAVMLVAACLVPGGALVRYLQLEFGASWVAIAAAVSLALEVAGSLALVWTGWWHPEVLAIGLAAVSALVIVVDWSRPRAEPGLPA
jgi:glycosyltransferase involved in cell wall biosynthesis